MTSSMGWRQGARLWAMLLAVGAAVAAQAQDTRSGKVYFANLTALPIQVRCVSYVDPLGVVRRPNADWSLRPKQQGYLLLDGKNFAARRIDFEVVARGATSKWHTNPSSFDADGDLAIDFTDRDLQAHHKSAAPPRTSGYLAPARSGSVRVVNGTGSPLTVIGVSYTDAAGIKRPISGSWNIANGANTRLQLDSRDIVARQFEFKLRTAAGTSSWVTDASDFDSLGYLTLNVDGAMFRRHLASAAGGPASGTLTPEKKEAIARAIVKLLGAAVADGVSKAEPGEKDDPLASFFVSALARAGRDALIESAVDDAFDDAPIAERRRLVTVVKLAMDGKLNLANVAAEERKEHLIRQLRREAPGLADIAGVVDFLDGLDQARRNAR